MARAEHKVRLYFPDQMQQIEGQELFSLEYEEKATISDEIEIPPLPHGSRILNGQYRIMRLLYQRPRLNLYLGRRCAGTGKQEPLVAIRELVLTGLSAQVSAQIEAAAFEEFVSPTVIGSPRLSSSGDRASTEGERHYLVIQLDESAKTRKSDAITLDDLLLTTRAWPSWLSSEVALQWGSQICRMVARLHRLGAKPGDVSPTTILVDRTGLATWPPVLLPSWPPAPQYWGTSYSELPTPLLHCRVFPVVKCSLQNVFVAPEALYGMSDARSDVYMLGAILYLLMTHYAPVAAARRLRVNYPVQGLQALDALELAAPCLLNTKISPEMEQVLLCALSLAPDDRYQSVFELVEALENVTLLP